MWEWLWLLSVPVTLLGLAACKHSSLRRCRQFLVATLTCSLPPILLGMGCHAQVPSSTTLPLTFTIATLFRIATNFLPKELQTMFKCGR